MAGRSWMSTIRDLDVPQLLVVGLGLSLLVGIVFALTTSAAAFGIYNPAWDGASGIAELAEETGADARVALNTTAYERGAPDETVAIVLSPDSAYSPTDRQRLRQFVRDGGTLVLAEDFGSQGNRLLASIGAQTRFDGRLLRDERHYYRAAALPIAPNVTNASYTQGGEQLTLNYGTSLRVNESSEETRVLVRSSEFSYLDGNRNGTIDDSETLKARPVVVREAVGEGAVLVVSDPSLFINAMLDRPGNRQFARNIFSTAERVILDYSHLSGRPPLSVALLRLRQTPLLQLLVGLLGIGGVLGWSRRPTLLRRAVARLDVRRRSRSASVEDVRMDQDTLEAYLRQKHPDWNDQRVSRIVSGILARRTEREDND